MKIMISHSKQAMAFPAVVAFSLFLTSHSLSGQTRSGISWIGNAGSSSNRTVQKARVPVHFSAAGFPVVDTGQDVCYDDLTEIPDPPPGDPYYGQDAQYDGNQPSYTISGDGLTVFDNVTGLTWMQDADLDGDGDIDVDDKLTFDEAQTYPDTINARNFGGYNDWRVPSIKELYSLMDFRGTDPMSDNPSGLVPFIDTTYFAFAYGDVDAGERIIDSQWVTSTLYASDDNKVFGVNFADGRIKGYDLIGGPGGEKTFYVRLCRGNTDYGVNSFIDNRDGTVTDHATSLMWSQDDSGDGETGPRSGMIWVDALAWVQQKNDENYLGYDDWRLPDAKEMQSIVDYTRAPDATGSAAIDPVFNITEIINEDGEVDYPWFWTGTTHARQDGSGEAGAYICFGRGLGYMFGSWIDIHGAGCQRSDRKDGDFTGYNYVPDGYYLGMAPQGDAARMYNYVRCVRGGLATSIEDGQQESNIPKSTRLSQNSPNPFNPRTTINYEIASPCRVRLIVYDLHGRRVRTLADEWQESGSHRYAWDGTDDLGVEVSSGIYLYRMIAGDEVSIRKMTLLR